MYTQILKEIPASAAAHEVFITYGRAPTAAPSEYAFDGIAVAHVQNVGVPLDQHGAFTGTYPSLGPG